MLKHMRAGAKSKVVNLILFGPLLLAMAALAMVGGQSNLRDAIRGDSVFSIGRDSVSFTVFDRLVQNTIQQNRQKQAEAYRAGLPRQLLQQEVNMRVLSLARKDAGLQIDDATAAKQIKELLAPLVEKGVSEKEAFERLLYSNNASEAQFVATVKDEMATQVLLKTVASGITPPAPLVADVLKFGNEYRRGSYIRLTPANAGDVKAPDDDGLKAYYGTVKGDYALPEYRTLSVVIVDKEALGDSIKVSDDKLRQYYEDNAAEFSTPESRAYEQAVFSDEAAATAAYNAAKAGKSLNDAAGGKGSYIKSGTYTKDKMAPELAKAVFGAKAGDVLPPVKSALGWHVVHVEKITPGTSKPFESVKDAIEKEMTQDSVAEALYKFANTVDDELAAGKDVSAVAKDNHLHETVLERIDAHGIGADGKKPAATLPVYDKLVKNGFSLPKGAASQLIETPDNGFAIVAVKQVYPSEQQPFEKLRDKLRARWVADHQLKALGAKAEKALAALKQGKSIDSVAADLGISPQSTGFVKRGAPSSPVLDSALVNGLFSLGAPGEATSVADNNVITILSFAERKIEPVSGNEQKEADNIKAVLTRAMQQDMMEQFRLSLLSKYDVSINEKLIAEKYAPKNAGTAAAGNDLEDDQ